MFTFEVMLTIFSAVVSHSAPAVTPTGVTSARCLSACLLYVV